MKKQAISPTKPAAKRIKARKLASFLAPHRTLSILALLSASLSAQESLVWESAEAAASTGPIKTNSSNHREHCIALNAILKQSEQCLIRCLDEASIKAELPKLKSLSRDMHLLAAAQMKLADPGHSDIKAAEQYLIEFMTTWNSIKKEIQRIEDKGLYSDELLEILRLKS